MKALRALIIVVVVLAVLVVVVEFGGRAVAQNYIRGQLVAAFPGTDPTVEIGSGSLILQAISGHLDSVHATIPDATLGTFTSDLTATATDVPLDPKQPLGSLAVAVTATAAEVQELVRNQDGLEAASVSIGSDVKIDSSATVLGIKVPYGFAVSPSASKGDLLLTPTSVSVNNATLSIADLKKAPFGSAIADLVKPQRVCVASYLPKVFTLASAAVETKTLRLTATGNGIALGTTDFTELGSCD